MKRVGYIHVTGAAARVLQKAGYLLLGCLLVGLVIFWFQGAYTASSLFWDVVYSIGYGGIIGTLMMFTMPRIAPLFWSWPPWAKWPALYGVMLALTAFGCLAVMLLFAAAGLAPWAYFWPSYFYGLRIAVVICIIVGTASIAYAGLQRRLEGKELELRTKELDRQKALNAATAARLASLESRIHPHFLFNALNSISSLIPEDPIRAERLVEQMSALLRFSLDSAQIGLVPLERELRIVMDYLEIEKARFGERLRYRVEVPDNLGERQLPPLSVQTLVENAVKYAVAPRIQGGEILVTGRAGEHGTEIEVVDDGSGFQPDAVTVGHGLDNLTARLTALYQGAGQLNIERRNERTVVSLLIPQPKQPVVEQT